MNLVYRLYFGNARRYTWNSTLDYKKAKSSGEASDLKTEYLPDQTNLILSFQVSTREISVVLTKRRQDGVSIFFLSLFLWNLIKPSVKYVKNYSANLWNQNSYIMKYSGTKCSGLVCLLLGVFYESFRPHAR